MASHLCKAIRDAKDSGVYDLKGLSQEQAVAFVESTFKEPIELDLMVKVTLVVGAGKLARQKYDDNLGKWVCTALKDIGYEDDRGASATLECAGSFKFQHDTGKNEKFVHVFPRVKAPPQGGDAEDGVGAAEAAHEQGGSGLPLSAEWLCVASELETFKQMVKAKMPAWLEKRRCLGMLKDELARLHECNMKLARLETLSPEEQRLVDNVDEDLITAKQAHLTERMKAMVDGGHLTQPEKDLVLGQVNERLQAVSDELAQSAADKPAKKERLAAAQKQLEERKAKIAQVEPIVHELANVAELRSIWRNLLPMDALLEKAGPKGRWSTKLSPAEVDKLGEKDELDERLAGLLSAARHWFEETDEFQARVDAVKKTIQPIKKKPVKQAAKPPAAPDGWSTVAAKKPANRKAGGSAGQKASGNSFAALFD